MNLKNPKHVTTVKTFLTGHSTNGTMVVEGYLNTLTYKLLQFPSLHTKTNIWEGSEASLFPLLLWSLNST